MAIGLNVNIDKLIEIIGPLLEKLQEGKKLTWPDWAKLMVGVFKVLRESTHPAEIAAREGVPVGILTHHQPFIDHRKASVLFDMATAMSTALGIAPNEPQAKGNTATVLHEAIVMLLQLLPVFIH